MSYKPKQTICGLQCNLELESMNDFVKMQAVMSAKDVKGDVNIYPEGVLTLQDVR